MLGFCLPRLYDHGIMSIIMNLFLDRDHRRGHFFDQLIVTLMSLKLSNTVSWPYETCSRSLTLGLSVQPGLHVLLFRRLFLKFKLFYNGRIIFIVTVKSSWPAKIYLRIKVYAENLLWWVLSGPKILRRCKFGGLQLFELLLHSLFQLKIVERILHLTLLDYVIDSFPGLLEPTAPDRFIFLFPLLLQMVCIDNFLVGQVAVVFQNRLDLEHAVLADLDVCAGAIFEVFLVFWDWSSGCGHRGLRRRGLQDFDLPVDHELIVLVYLFHAVDHLLNLVVFHTLVKQILLDFFLGFIQSVDESLIPSNSFILIFRRLDTLVFEREVVLE